MQTTVAPLAPELKQAVKEAGLRYISAQTKGISRHAASKGFIYRNFEGQTVKDETTLNRIKALVLPPAWQEVWISPYANSHLQATGVDARGRKQYRYHPGWVKLRSEKKFDNLYAFGQGLPRLRRALSRDIASRSFTRDKVCAIAISVMLQTSIRVGNAAYEKENGSYGLTTLKRKHVSFHGSLVQFKFKGKKGVLQEVALKQTQLAKLLSKMNDLPGRPLFQYYDEERKLQQLHSEELNEYLRNIMGELISCKVVRTWAGCTHFLLSIAPNEPYQSKTECKKNIVEAIDAVACKLGNTRSVCKNYYIHPALLEQYEQDGLCALLGGLKGTASQEKQQATAERVLMKFLKALSA